jgi:hypothetical protein
VEAPKYPPGTPDVCGCALSQRVAATSRGWIVLIVGILQLTAAFSIWAGNEYGRWMGIASAGLNSIVMLMFIPAYPFGALAAFAIDVLVIYGLAAYGGRMAGHSV